jgi:hypothetical protein
MFSWLRGRLASGSKSESPQLSIADIPQALEWAESIPYLNWDAIEEWISSQPGTHSPNDYRCEIQRQWVDELADVFGPPYLWTESDELILLTARPAAEASDILRIAERRYRATKDVVGAPNSPQAKLVILCFDSQEHMYDYLAPMYPEGEFGGVGGFCVLEGPPHIALPDLRDSFEPTLLHEMTHACLGKDVPGWLQEGIAQIVEHRLLGHQPTHLDERRIRRHRHHWSKRGLQAFWEARSFSDPDRGQELSYELAYVLVSITAGDERDRFAAFLRAATSNDFGAAAAEQHLGFSLGELAGRFLGSGNWQPQPSPDEPQSMDPLSQAGLTRPLPAR